MHPAHLRIHPARPGGGSRAPGAGPSERPAPCLPGGPDGDTGGHAPGLPRSFHFESTLRKFAKLVSRWLLRRPGRAPRINLRQQRLQAAPGGPGAGSARRAWEAGRDQAGRGLSSGAVWAAPQRASQTLTAGCCLGGALGPRPSAGSLPAPGPAPPRPRPSRLLFYPGGSRPRGASRDDRYGDAGARPGRAGDLAHSPAASPPDLPGGGAEEAARREAEPGPPAWLCSSGARERSKASHPTLVGPIHGFRGPQCRAGSARGGQ